MKRTFPFPIAILAICSVLASPPDIGAVSDNRNEFSDGDIPKYEKFEITFTLKTDALNPYWPYDEAAPPGIPSGAGVSVDGLFTPDEWKTVYRVPGFFYQEFEEIPLLRGWLYSKDSFSWKIRFAPHQAGTWQYRVTVRDAGGTVESPTDTFVVVDSDNKGFVRVSRKDPRYFEFSEGQYFPGMGFNLNFRQIDWIEPASNEETFQALQAHGIQLVRTWISQWSIFGSAWGQWYSHNRVHRTQEPQMGLTHEQDENLFSNYPEVTPPLAAGDVYMWLNHDETVSADGNQWSFTPCRVFGWETAKVPLRRNRTYRLRVRYQIQGLKGPRVMGEPFGFVVKEGGWLWPESESGRCYYPGTGNVLAATYQLSEADPWTNFPDPEFPGWRILEGRFDNSDKDFIEFLYLALENVHASDGGSAGHAFIDHVWVQEDLGGEVLGPNLIHKPSMDHHFYINQRDALALDKVLDLASRHDIYLKAVILEKNDFIFSILEFDGQRASVKNSELFYGNGREENGKTKVRWLQEVWWRYLQARWGYSTNIHSWELLNEGPPGPQDGPHWILADEFGKFIKCQVFDLEVSEKCSVDHPNVHLVTTSFWSGFPFHFWNNTSGAYSNLDFVDIHQAVQEGQPFFEDAAMATQNLSAFLAGQLSENARKPVVRGEVAWFFAETDQFKENVSNGLWLHNFVWGGINAGGLIEHYWTSSPTDGQIQSSTHDHRQVFRAFYDFIKNVPLNNGNYREAEAVASSSDLRVWGQTDPVNERAHLWIQNKSHTWGRVADDQPIPAVESEITIPNMGASKLFWIQWWDTRTGIPVRMELARSDSAGALVLSLIALVSDAAIQIYPAGIRPLQPPPRRTLEIIQ